MKTLKKWHKWLSLFFSPLILLFSVSGIILNHRQTFSGFDISRDYIPETYRYKNWNLAAVKGSIPAGNDSILVFGNIGIWKTDNGLTGFRDFNQGFPAGIDNRKVGTLTQSAQGDIFAGTQFGLFRFCRREGLWVPVELPESGVRVVKVLTHGDSLLVMTRSSLYLGSARNPDRGFRTIVLPAAADDDQKTGLFRTLWVIHSGEIYGIAGKLLVDLTGAAMIIISLTGLIYFLMPFLLQRVRSEIKSRMKRFNRFSLRWHNRLGSWGIGLLILTAVTGIFLRPPLLIPIAGSRVGKIPFSTLDNPNHWHDRLRDFLYEPDSCRFMVATSEGIYFSDDTLKSLIPFGIQPPVSVMGINVFRKTGEGEYLVGSFSGIFDWNLRSGTIRDHFTGEIWMDPGKETPPFGNVSVAGYIQRQDGNEITFDYAQGALVIRPGRFIAPMTQTILDQSPVSLWNFNLEVHTGRIFQPLIGDFYILVVPVTGIFILVILITGFLVWWKARKKRKAVTLQPLNNGL